MKSKEKLIIIFLVIASIIGWLIFYIEYQDKKQVTKILMNEKDSLSVELSELSNDYDGLKVNNDSLSNQIEAQKIKLHDILADVKRIKANNAEQIFKYKKELGTMREIMKNYVRQIDELNQKNMQLMAENNQVKTENFNVKTENQKLNTEKEQLNETVKKASVLQAISIEIVGIKSGTKITNVASKVNQLKISFKLPANVVANKGKRTIYARIAMPDQLILSQNEANLFDFNGEKISYSAKKEIDYNGETQEVIIYWTNENKIKLIPGNYAVEIFTENYQMGEAKFTLTKGWSLF